MANNVEKLNGIAVTDIETVNGKTDANIEALNGEELVGEVAFSASGGTETTYSSGGTDYKVHTFLSSGTFTVVGNTGMPAADFLVVAGGSTGQNMGGGGAGGFRPSSGTSGAGASAETAITLSAQAYSVVVGAGGTSLHPGTFRHAIAGNDSSALGITSIKGELAGQTGGSGGAVSWWGSAASTRGLGTAGQGNQGGTGAGGAPYGGGGGGGAAAAGGNMNYSGNPATDKCGAGGAGQTNSIRTGSGVYYAGGGGGGCYYPTGYNQGGDGGIGGGGTGGGYYGSYVSGISEYCARHADANGVANTGGGGASGNGSTSGAGYGEGNHGGSGIVVIRYAV